MSYVGIPTPSSTQRLRKIHAFRARGASTATAPDKAACLRSATKSRERGQSHRQGLRPLVAPSGASGPSAPPSTYKFRFWRHPSRRTYTIISDGCSWPHWCGLLGRPVCLTLLAGTGVLSRCGWRAQDSNSDTYDKRGRPDKSVDTPTLMSDGAGGVPPLPAQPPPSTPVQNDLAATGPHARFERRAGPRMQDGGGTLCHSGAYFLKSGSCVVAFLPTASPWHSPRRGHWSLVTPCR